MLSRPQLPITEEERQRLIIFNRVLNPVSQAFLQRCGVKPGQHILEVGCGSGEMSCWLAKQVGPSGRIVAIDANSEQIKLCHETVKRHKLNNITFLVASVMDLTDYYDQFDIVYNRFLLLHLYDPVMALNEMRRCLNSAGSLVCEDAIYSYSFTDPSNAAYDRLVKLYVQAMRLYGKDPDFGKRLYSELVRANFTDIEINLHQPVIFSPEDKMILRLRILLVKQDLIASRLASEEEIEALLKDLENDEQSSQSYWTLATVCQVCGCKL